MTEKSKLDPGVVRIAVVVIVGALAVIFDTTIVSVALHTLATDLHTSVDTIQWVSTGYLLALGVTIPIVGWFFAFFVIPYLSVGLWLLLMYKAYKGVRFKLPWVGDFAERS